MKKKGLRFYRVFVKRRRGSLSVFFVIFKKTKKPYIILKVASSLDGRIATESKDSKWLTQDGSRQKAHKLRQEVDAVLIGGGTLLHDNPYLTARDDKGLLRKRQPYRIVVTSKIIKENAHIFNEGYEKVVILRKSDKKDNDADKRLREKGVQFFYYQKDAIAEALFTFCREKRVLSVCVEGGSQLLQTFFERKIFQELWVFISPHMIGGGELWQKGFQVQRVKEGLKPYDHKVELCQETDILWRGFYSKE